MVRTTVMLPDETYAALRRLARRRGEPLAALIRRAVTELVDNERRAPSFIGAIAVEGPEAASTAGAMPPIPAFRSEAPSAKELDRLRRLADQRASDNT